MANKPMTREEAARIANVVYGTDLAAVLELLLLAHNGDRVTSYRASRALLLFDQAFQAMPTKPSLKRCA